MRYGKKITNDIYEELLRMPNIRYVCKKVGINPSTFYRWMSIHHAFYKLVTAGLAMGRERMNDAAESVIISGIQRNEFKSATYWLSHNDPQYSNKEQLEKILRKTKSLVKVLKESTPNNAESKFETFFEAYESMQKIFGIQKAEKRIHDYVRVFCEGDLELEKIFYVAYSEWKTAKDEMEKMDKDITPPDLYS